MALPRAGKHLFAAGFQQHAAAVQPLAEIGVQRFVEHILPVAKTAAQIGFDDAHLSPGQAKRLADHAPHDMRDLRGADDHDLAAFAIGKADRRFDMAMLHRLRAVDAMQMQQPRLCLRRRQVAAAVAVLFEHIARADLRMQRHGVRSHRLLHRKIGRIFLVFHLDRAAGALCRHLVYRHHGRDFIAKIAHAAVEQAPVCHILMRAFHRPGMAGGGKSDIRHIETGDHQLYPGHGCRRRGIDALDTAIGNAAVQDTRHQRARRAKICRIAGGAGHLIQRIHARHAFADNALLSHIPPPFLHQKMIFPARVFHTRSSPHAQGAKPATG